MSLAEQLIEAVISGGDIASELKSQAKKFHWDVKVGSPKKMPGGRVDIPLIGNPKPYKAKIAAVAKDKGAKKWELKDETLSVWM